MGHKNKQLTYAELFAGCGGMSLGLEAAGFRRIFANELSPMAANTYAFNLGRECDEKDFSAEESCVRICDKKRRSDGKWENDPRSYFEDSPSKEIPKELSDLNGQLFVGNILQLVSAIALAKKRGKLSKRALNLDILAGGPPCQSFSLVGRREQDNPRNSLPFAFVKLARILKPKVILLENVSGILRPFTDSSGKRTHAWQNIALEFFKAGYIPICTHASAKEYGVPQNRPRFVMIGLRSDLAGDAERNLATHPTWRSVVDHLKKSAERFEFLSTAPPTARQHVEDYMWAEPGDKLWPKGLCKTVKREGPPFADQAIGDLREHGARRKSPYLNSLASEFPAPGGRDFGDDSKNREHRRHGPVVRARFRLLRVLAISVGAPVTNNFISNTSPAELATLVGSKNESLLIPLSDGSWCEKASPSASDIEQLVSKVASRKHSQRALLAKRPAPAQLSIPDDMGHYAEDRTLTVREMARIQSFPDWFNFRDKVTTGGEMRAYEVPRYTQVGNAVPPLMAKKLGMGISRLLREIQGGH